MLVYSCFYVRIPVFPVQISWKAWCLQSEIAHDVFGFSKLHVPALRGAGGDFLLGARDLSFMAGSGVLGSLVLGSLVWCLGFRSVYGDTGHEGQMAVLSGLVGGSIRVVGGFQAVMSWYTSNPSFLQDTPSTIRYISFRTELMYVGGSGRSCSDSCPSVKPFPLFRWASPMNP